MDAACVENIRQRVAHISPWGAELAGRAARARDAADFEMAALRRIEQQFELGLGDDAVRAVWECLYLALASRVPLDKSGQPAMSSKWLLDVQQQYQRHSWRCVLASALVALDLDYPFKRGFLNAEAMFCKLREHAPVLVPNKPLWKPTAPPIAMSPLLERPPLPYHKTTADDYETMDALTDVFTEPARLSARYYDRQSVLDLWANDALLRHQVYLDAIRCPDPRSNSVNAHAVREAAFQSKGMRECTQFKATLAKAVYLHFKATRVLDFSAGWGDRLVAALATPAVVKYHAVDPNPALAEGHAAMIARWNDQGRDFIVSCKPAEKALFSGTFDLVFTSPPFWKVETYTDAPGQSTQGRNTLSAWLCEFLFPTLAKAWDALDDNGHLVLHLNDGQYLICHVTVLYCVARLARCDYLGIMGSRGANGAIRPMWVFAKRPDACATQSAASAAEGELCKYWDVALRLGVVTIDDVDPDKDYDDVRDMLSNRQLMCWVGDHQPWDRAKVDRLFRHLISERQSASVGAHRHWVVKHNGRVCGFVRVRPVPYAKDGASRLTVIVCPTHQGCGIGSRATRLVAQACCESGTSVRAEVRPENRLSINMLVKAGCRRLPDPVMIGRIPHVSFQVVT